MKKNYLKKNQTNKFQLILAKKRAKSSVFDLKKMTLEKKDLNKITPQQKPRPRK